MAIPDGGVLTKEKIQAQARLLLQPLDLDDLIAKGILSKKGAWYRILKFEVVPAHAWAQVSEIAKDPHGSSIKFSKLSKRGRAQLAKIVASQ